MMMITPLKCKNYCKAITGYTKAMKVKNFTCIESNLPMTKFLTFLTFGFSANQTSKLSPPKTNCGVLKGLYLLKAKKAKINKSFQINNKNNQLLPRMNNNKTMNSMWMIKVYPNLFWNVKEKSNRNKLS